MTSFGSPSGSAWKRSPTHPWHSFVPAKLRAEMVSAKTKKREEPARDLLARADLRDRAEDRRVEVDQQRLLMRVLL
jgi:hypothetical protein